MANYATAAELKTKNSAVELTHSDDEIDELLEAASREIDYLTANPDGFFGDGIPASIKAATIYLALFYFRLQSSAGISAERIADRSYTVDKPETVKRRLSILLDKHNPPSLI